MEHRARRSRDQGRSHWALAYFAGTENLLRPSKVSVAITPQAPFAVLSRGWRRVAGVPESIDGTLETARKRYEQTRPRASGDGGDFVGAIADNMNNTRVYAADNHLGRPHRKPRLGKRLPMGFPYFEWDSFFNANLAAVDDPAIARNTIHAHFFLPERLKEWFPTSAIGTAERAWIGRSRRWPRRNASGRCNQRYPDDLDFLREVYPKMVAYHAWWPKYRDAKKDEAARMGHVIGRFQGAQFETGWDDNLHYQICGTMHGNTMNCYTVDLCSLMVDRAALPRAHRRYAGPNPTTPRAFARGRHEFGGSTKSFGTINSACIAAGSGMMPRRWMRSIPRRLVRDKTARYFNDEALKTNVAKQA